MQFEAKCFKKKVMYLNYNDIICGHNVYQSQHFAPEIRIHLIES